MLGLGLKGSPALDSIRFGDSASEAEHGLTASLSASASGPTGTSLNQPYRYFTPASPVGIYGGSTTFTMTVDPSARNYFSIKLWGGDDDVTDSTHKGRLYVYVIIDGVEYQIGYRHEGDHTAHISNDSPYPTLPGRFFYSTTLLPLWMTQGENTLTFKIVSTGRIYALGNGYAGSGGNYQFNMDKNSRGVYRAYTHVNPQLSPVGETQGTAPSTTLRPESVATTYLGSGSTFHNAVKGQINNRLNNTPDIATSNFSPEGVEFLAYSYFVTGQINPSQTALPGYNNAAVVTRVRDVLDLYSTYNYANPSQAGANWGGKYGALGHAVSLLATQFGTDLDASVDYGSAGGTKTRRLAWADMLYASREAGRTNRNRLTNQALIADGNIYKANRGLLALGDSRAMAENDAQRYLKESAGIEPWRGSDLAGGGHELPFGGDYYQITPKGLSREWGYVGGNYGEIAHYIARYYRMTGNSAFSDQVAKITKARANFRTPAIDVSGTNNYSRMQVIGFLAWRGASESDGNGIGSDTAYAGRPGAATGLINAAITLDPAVIGYAKQMLADRQLFAALNSSSGNYSTLEGLDTFADYVTVATATDSGIRLPMTTGQPDYAWADEENGVLALKNTNERLWIAPFWQCKTGTGINGVARFHYSNGTWDQVGTMETTPRFDFGGSFFTRPALIDKPEEDRYVPPSPPLNAYAGEKIPLGIRPADASADDPFRGKVNFYAFRFGRYLFGMNRTSDRAYDLITPVGFTSATDLFSGATRTGPINVPAASTVALILPDETDANPVPATPSWLDIDLGEEGPYLTWAAASRASSYTIRRAENSAGPFVVIATGITATAYSDEDVSTGSTYYYTVSAVNSAGESYESHLNSCVAASGKAIISFNLAPSTGSQMLVGDLGGAPGARAGNWVNYAGGTLSSGINDAAGKTVNGLTVSLSNGNSGGFSDRGGSLGDDATLFRTLLDKFNGTAASLSVTGIPHANYDVYFYVYPDENTTGANDRGGSFTIGSTTYFVRTGAATKVSGANDYIRATSTSLGTGMNVALANYARFTNRSGNLSATFTAQNINGGAQRLKVVGFQIVGLVASAPISLSATTQSGGIALSWDAVSGSGVSYVVKRSTSASGPFLTVARDLATTSYTDTAVDAGTTYYYVVTAANSAGQSAPSPTASAITLPAVPGALAAVAVDSQRIDLTWSLVNGAASYSVQRAASASGSFATVSSALVSAAFSDTGLTNGTTYFYRVVASNTSGNSSPSSTVSATTLTRLQGWRLTHFGRVDANETAADDADPDADGAPNLLEYATGTLPLANTSGKQPTLSITTLGLERRLRLIFERIDDPTIVYSVLASSEIDGPWTSVWQSSQEQNTPGLTEYIDQVSLTATPRRFLKLRVTTTP